MEFSRQYWRGLLFPSPGDLPDPGNEHWVSCIASRFFTIWATRTTLWMTSKEASRMCRSPRSQCQIGRNASHPVRVEEKHNREGGDGLAFLQQCQWGIPNVCKAITHWRKQGRGPEPSWESGVFLMQVYSWQGQTGGLSSKPKIRYQFSPYTSFIPDKVSWISIHS